jgi:hypothetical protein
MPRPVSRRYQPYLAALKRIALDDTQPVALRLRAIEISIALLSGICEVAAGKVAANAVRSLVARDAIDHQLLELRRTITGIEEQLEPKDLEEHRERVTQARREKAIDDLLARAQKEKEIKDDTTAT